MRLRPTPRTDAREARMRDAGCPDIVTADFCRVLERELAFEREEGEEQARLLGMSAEREAGLLAKIERLERRIKTLEAIIRSARTEFFKEGSDGKTCVRMLDVLASADDQDQPLAITETNT